MDAGGTEGEQRLLKRPVTLTFEPFGWQRIAAEGVRSETRLVELVRRSAMHYESRLPLQLPSRLIPRFATERTLTGRAFELPLESRAWFSLGAEADRQSVAVERLIEHVVLLYLARMDSSPASADPAARIA